MDEVPLQKTATDRRKPGIGNTETRIKLVESDWKNGGQSDYFSFSSCVTDAG
jgi:hypothetical protein